MRKVRPGEDWGERSPRWRGVTSQVVTIDDTVVHYLCSSEAAAARPPHLLVHPMGSGSWSWMDVIGPLSAHGSVIAPDLPGSGRTRPARRGPRSIEANARFLEAFVAALGMDRVVVHGHSMGGLVGGVFAGLAPDRVERLVLTSAPVPGSPDPMRAPGLWRAALDAGRPVARILVGAGLRLKADAWRRWMDDPGDAGMASAMRRHGTDPSRISPELLDLVADEVGHLQLSWRVDGAVDAAGAVFRALTVDEATTRAHLDRIVAPVRLLWGAEDRVIPGRLIDDVRAARPTWTSQTVEGVGHLLPWEDPARYVELAT